jgi:hypothetical protein
MAALKKVLSVLSAVAFSTLIGCSDKPLSVDNENDYSGGTSAALFKIAAGPNTPFSRIAHSASVTITAPDMNKFSQKLIITDSTVEGTVTGIPAGKNRLFTVAVFDSLDSLQYQGTATADLPRGSTVNVPITLYRIGANAIINGNVVETTLSDSMVLFLPLDSNINDQSGNNVSLNLSGTAIWANGIAGKGLSLDGSTAIVVDTIKMHNSKNATFAYWFKIPSSYSSLPSDWKLCGYLENHDGTSGQALRLGFWTNNYCVFDPGLTLMTLDQPPIAARSISKSFSSDTWYHLALVMRGDTGWGTYINGQKLNSGSGNVPSTFKDIPFFGIGCTLEGSKTPLQYLMKGTIDQVRLYNRALSDTEITALYSNNM